MVLVGTYLIGRSPRSLFYSEVVRSDFLLLDFRLDL